MTADAYKIYLLTKPAACNTATAEAVIERGSITQATTYNGIMPLFSRHQRKVATKRCERAHICSLGESLSLRRMIHLHFQKEAVPPRGVSQGRLYCVVGLKTLVRPAWIPASGRPPEPH